MLVSTADYASVKIGNSRCGRERPLIPDAITGSAIADPCGRPSLIRILSETGGRSAADVIKDQKLHLPPSESFAHRTIPALSF